MDISPQVAEYEEYRILSDHLKTSGDINVTTSRFTNPLCQALENAKPAYSLPKEQITQHLERAWTSILLLASETPHDSPKQAELMKFMTNMVQQIPLEDLDGKSIVVDDSKVWTDLPFFGFQIRESWNFPSFDEVDQTTRDKWININAFVARLTAAFWAVSSGQQKVESWVNASALDFSLFGIWTLRSALEEDIKKGNTGDALIGAAAAWLVYAGPALKGLSEKGKEFEGKVARAGGNVREKEWKGFSTERLQVWEDELEKLQNVAQGQDVQALVSKALESRKQ